MNGTIAIYGQDIYFSETIPKPNSRPCRIPMESWLDPEGGIFIPLSSEAWNASKLMDTKFLDMDLPGNLDIPKVCGISVRSTGAVFEIAVSENRLVVRPVPTGAGVIYTRAVYPEYEENMYAAIKLTGDLRKAVELASQTTVGLSVEPIFTTIPIMVFAAATKKVDWIRKMTKEKLNEILSMVMADEESKDLSSEEIMRVAGKIMDMREIYPDITFERVKTLAE